MRVLMLAKEMGVLQMGTMALDGTKIHANASRHSALSDSKEAVAAYRAALEERTRERVPLDWAMTRNKFDAALQTLGERESGIARLEEAAGQPYGSRRPKTALRRSRMLTSPP